MDVAGSWRDAIPLEEWEIYESAGFGRRVGFGVKPALLIIDVQYRTVGHAPLPIKESIQRYYRTSCGLAGWQAVSAIQDLLDSARRSRIPVIYPHVAEKDPRHPGKTGTKIPSLMKVERSGYEFVQEIAPSEEDIRIPKHHPSAFFGTALTSYLIDLNVDTVLLTGCTTSGCIRATATDAFALNFHTCVVEECVYDRSQVSHDVNLFDIQAKYADVISLEEAKKVLDRVP